MADPSEMRATFLMTMQAGRYGSTAVYALLVYEWLLMLSEEYDLIHRAQWTTFKFAYLVCRYYPLLIWPFFMWAWLRDLDQHMCSRVVRPVYMSLIPFEVAAQGVIFIRAYAFTGRKKWVFVLLGTCYIALLAIDIWAFSFDLQTVHKALYDLYGPMGCWRDLTYRNSALKTGLLLVASVVLDILALVLVVAHCIRLRSVQGSLGKAFLQQGVSAFFAMTSVNLVAATIYFIPRQGFKGAGLSFSFILTNIIACRLILVLRRKTSPTDTQISRAHSELVRDALAFDTFTAPGSSEEDRSPC